MENEHVEHAKKVGIGYTDKMFKDVVDNPHLVDYPIESLPGLCGRAASTCLLLASDDKVWSAMPMEVRKELEQVAYDAASNRARELIERAKKAISELL